MLLFCQLLNSIGLLLFIISGHTAYTQYLFCKFDYFLFSVVDKLKCQHYHVVALQSQYFKFPPLQSLNLVILYTFRDIHVQRTLTKGEVSL